MIIDKPYAERRIVIVTDKKAQQETQAAAGAPRDDKAADAGGLIPIPSLLSFAFLVVKTVYGDGERSAGIKEAQRPAGTLLASIHEARSQLEFPPGHPVVDHAYAGHPLTPTRYLPLAAFHSFLFEEKVNELMTLLASLGATRVKVSCTRGYRTTAGASFGVSKGAEAAAGVKGNSEHSQQASFEEHYRPKGEPKLPPNPVWYGSEASWQALAQRRLEFGTSQFKTRLSYEDSFGIDANLKVGLEQLGVKLGGNFANFEATEWEFEGEFA